MTLVRSTLSALAEAGGLEAELTDDLKTAVSEACNNVVLHAYPAAHGPLILRVSITLDGVEAIVEDHGAGIRHITTSDSRMGLGLAVISALADRAEFRSLPDHGTTVRMAFHREGDAEQPWLDVPAGLSADTRVELPGDVVLWLSPASGVGIVLGRLIRAVAATSHFTLQCMPDLHSFSDALGSYAARCAAGSSVGFSIDATPRRMHIVGGPFRIEDGVAAPVLGGSDGGAATRVQRPGVETLAELAEELSIEAVPDGELLAIALADHSRD